MSSALGSKIRSTPCRNWVSSFADGAGVWSCGPHPAPYFAVSLVQRLSQQKSERQSWAGIFSFVYDRGIGCECLGFTLLGVKLQKQSLLLDPPLEAPLSMRFGRDFDVVYQSEPHTEPSLSSLNVNASLCITGPMRHSKNGALDHREQYWLRKVIKQHEQLAHVGQCIDQIAILLVRMISDNYCKTACNSYIPAVVTSSNVLWTQLLFETCGGNAN